MTLTKDTTVFDSGTPANYQIVVQGTISEDWSNRLGGLAIASLSHENGESRTILEGRLLDQSALRGLLESLFALHLPILEVRKIGSRRNRVGNPVIERS
jgi:hypothetical protein